MNSPRPSILIVDDSPADILLVGKALGNSHEVRFATSGQEALTLIRKRSPDLILLDIIMPVMNGHQLCSKLKANPATRDIPIIFVTATDCSENEVRTFEAGAVDYVRKPIDIPILQSRIRNQLQLYYALTELRLAASVFHNTMEGILIADAEKRIIDVNRAFCLMSGYNRDDLIDANINMLQSDRHETLFYKVMWDTVQTQGHWNGEVWSRFKNGESHPQLLNLSLVKNSSGEISHFVSIYSHIRFLLDQSKRLEHLAYHDALTGLPNRRLLMDRLQQAVSQTRRRRNQVAIALIDLDGFKPVNDCFGHCAGDTVLTQISNRLTEILRSGDTIGRLGGDEFVVIMSDLNAEHEIESSLKRILQTIAEPIALPQAEVVVTGCIGLAFYPQHGLEPELLVRRADQAMYQAKAAGSNCFRIYNAGQLSTCCD